MNFFSRKSLKRAAYRQVSKDQPPGKPETAQPVERWLLALVGILLIALVIVLALR